MRLIDIVIDENSLIKTAVNQLEANRCKVVYVLREGKLVASVTDGDIRRYLLLDGDLTKPISVVANYNPHFYYVYEKEKIEETLESTEILSLPVINYNKEIIAVYFRNGLVVREKHALNCPIVMMAGGKGTRLYPYTRILPKALIPIGETPISELIIDRFSEYQCNDFFMIVNHKKEMIQAYYNGIDKPYNINYLEETTPLGTGGGLYMLKGRIDKDFFLVNCDILIDADYDEIYKYHNENNNFITIVGAKYYNIIPYGVLHYDNEQNTFEDIEEKPCTEYCINTGMYIVNPELLVSMPQNTNLSFPDMIMQYRNEGKKIGIYVIDEDAYMDMGQIEELEKMKKKLNK